VRDAVALMDDDCTVPFIARYRKETTAAPPYKLNPVRPIA
jgi:transcriptional accessory protein Tex/SPT6